MARYIDADAILKRQRKMRGFGISFEDEFWDYAVLAEDIRNEPAADVEEVRCGKWEECDGHEDGYYHHRCSVCKEDAIYRTIYEMDYDEGVDGEWYECGERNVGIEEKLTPRCPYCGAKMDRKETSE